MSKIQNNPIMKGASGMLGDVVVYRRFRGNVIMSNRPKKPTKRSPQQEDAKWRFLRAVQYAKRQIADPSTKAFYQPSPDSRYTSAYSAALADYLSPPTVHSIDATAYSGTVGNEIYVRAFDEFGLATVRVSIFKADGSLLEQGVPELKPDSVDEYIYKTTIANDVLSGTKITVTAVDKPGNTMIEEKVL